MWTICLRRGCVCRCRCFPFSFLNKEKPLKESGICGLWQRLVFIQKSNLPSCTICYKKKGVGGEDEKRRKEDYFLNLSVEKISGIAVSSSYFYLPLLPCLSRFYLSPYIFNLSHKAHYSCVPAAIAVALSQLLAIH